MDKRGLVCGSSKGAPENGSGWRLYGWKALDDDLPPWFILVGWTCTWAFCCCCFSGILLPWHTIGMTTAAADGPLAQKQASIKQGVEVFSFVGQVALKWL